MEDKKRAFTYVELMIVMSVSVLVFGIIYNFYYHITHESQDTVEEIELSRTARLFLDRCVNDLLKAVEIEKLTPTKIVFKKFKRDFSLNELNEYDRVSYVLGGKNKVLVRIVNGKSETLIKNIKVIPKIFQGFIEDISTEKFYPYDYKSNSQIELKKVSFIRIRISLSKRKYKFTLRTAVCCRRIHFHNLEEGVKILQ